MRVMIPVDFPGRPWGGSRPVSSAKGGGLFFLLSTAASIGKAMGAEEQKGRSLGCTRL